MKIIILAAGKGERLRPFTLNTPKALLDMGNGNTLLEEQLKSFTESGVIHEIVLVIGYLADQIEAKIRLPRAHGLDIKTVYNPFYEVSNNLISLWLARAHLDEDFMITNGDNLFIPEVFSDFSASCGEGIFLAVSPKAQYDYDDMKVALEHQVVARVSKTIEPELARAESPGLALVRGLRARGLFQEHLELLVRTPEYLNQFWLEVFNLLYARGVPVHPWCFDAAQKWQEVDFHGDLHRLKDILRLRLKANLPSFGPREEAPAPTTTTGPPLRS